MADPIRALKGAQNLDRQTEDRIIEAGKQVVHEAEQAQENANNEGKN